MNVYDKAYELEKAIKGSAEFEALRSALQAVEADADAKRMLDDFQAKQGEFQGRMMQGDMPSQSEMETLNKLYEVLQLHPLLTRYLEAERRFGIIMEDISRIMTGPLRQLRE